jgi:hypothetical protein
MPAKGMGREDESTMTLAEINVPELKTVCERYGVKELYAFGSVVTGEMNDHSDLDFIVRFDESAPKRGAFDRFMGLMDDLATLYRRRVDLLTLKPFRNPVFQAEVDRTKVLLYAA